ncbi:hypothetical protein [Streptomyces tanashiensis]|uniref:Secreted protein n=1 Tax=Streptomyces tanashiensis TaxID=67367 RepID=A0ABY6QNC0_9ACTN|nr:hypothetical protein [Streptomyces tanashiensis]UZX19283.1 hypothetical protein LDH80_00280 [Streptomyces tanashiensis]GGY15918.1 hypothetical protein GCM10010299_20750 [Streptomyces tanashiensis]
MRARFALGAIVLGTALLTGGTAAAQESPVASTSTSTAAPYCGGMYAYAPTKSFTTVSARTQASGCQGSPSLTMRLYRDGSQVSSYSWYGANTITLSTGCTSGRHLYEVTLRNNSNGVEVSNRAWITC